jgi:hypothetical protein
MGAILTGWGAVMTLAGVTQNFAGLFVVRFFLGVFGRSMVLPSAVLEVE